MMTKPQYECRDCHRTFTTAQQARLAIDAGYCVQRTTTARLADEQYVNQIDSDNIVVEHHKRQTSITFQWVLVMEVENGLLLPFFEPPITRDLAVVFVDLSVAFKPCVVLACGQLGPLE